MITLPLAEIKVQPYPIDEALLALTVRVTETLMRKAQYPYIKVMKDNTGYKTRGRTSYVTYVVLHTLNHKFVVCEDVSARSKDDPDG